MKVPTKLLRLYIIEVVELCSQIQCRKYKCMFKTQLTKAEISVLTQGTQKWKN